MSEIIGRDCDGKPLRAGDRVVPLPGVEIEEGCPQPPWTASRRAFSTRLCRPVIAFEESYADGSECGGPEDQLRLAPREDGQELDSLETCVPEGEVLQ